MAGRHCESGDEIARDVELPADVHPGDLLAVACTGAYQHSMASNYNMVARPPIIAVRHGQTRELVRRETTADLLARDLGCVRRRRRRARLAPRPVRRRPSPASPGANALAAELVIWALITAPSGSVTYTREIGPRNATELTVDVPAGSAVDGHRLRPHHRQPGART